MARRGCNPHEASTDDAGTNDAGKATARQLTRRQLLGAGVAGGAGLLLAACSGSGTVNRAASIRPSGKDLEAVEHVVFVMQENRSFDHYFGTYRGVRGFNDHQGANLGPFAQPWPANGSTPHASQLLPYNLDAATLHAECAGSSDIPIHDWAPQHQSWNGGHPNFVAVHSQSIDGPAQAPLVMGYLTRSDLSFYYALADAFTICDNYYCSVMGPTMPNRLYFMSGTIDPAGAHGGPVLFTPGLSDAAQAVGSVSWPTMPEQLSAHNISWKVYQPPGTSVGPVQPIALATGFNVLLYFKQYLQPGSDLYNRAFLPSWPDEFAADVRQGTLPQVSWLLPPLDESEHPSAAPELGEPFVSQVLRTLTANPDVWSKTVLFVTYDENGGFFDHVVPPTPPPGTGGEFLTASPLPAAAGGIGGPIGLGFRVPTLVVSPFSRGGYVDSDAFDHTSALRFLETRFGVPVPNLSTWRRNTVGDLTSALSFGSKDTSVPSLPATPVNAPPGCPDALNPISLLAPAPPLAIPTNQQMPSQEAGSARRRS